MSSDPFWNCIGGASACVVGLAVVAMTVQHRDAEAIRREVRSLGATSRAGDPELFYGSLCLTLLLVPLLLAGRALAGVAAAPYMMAPPVLLVFIACAVCACLSSVNPARNALFVGAFALLTLAFCYVCPAGSQLKQWLESFPISAEQTAVSSLVAGLFATLLLARGLQTGHLLRVRVTGDFRREIEKGLRDLRRNSAAYLLLYARCKKALGKTQRVSLKVEFFARKQLVKRIRNLRSLANDVAGLQVTQGRRILRLREEQMAFREELDDQTRRLADILRYLSAKQPCE